MSVHQPYDFALLDFARLDGATWTPVEVASFTCAEQYTPNDAGTLIYQSETAAVSMSYWDTHPLPLISGESVRARYDGKTIFTGLVDTVSYAYTTDPQAAHHGAHKRVDFTATMVGMYAALLTHTVCWTYLPSETPLQRISRFVTVEGY